MFDQLVDINHRPEPFEFYTAADLWTGDHTSEQMLAYHLNEAIDVSSRNGAFIDRSVEWIISHFRVGPGAKVADFGCGPGLYTNRFAKTDAEVTGIDFSSRSIDHAQKVASGDGLRVRYHNANYLDFETDDRFDLICMIMCDFCALSRGQRQHMLAKFFRLLKPGGAVLLDVYSLSAFAKREEDASYEMNQLDGFWSPARYYGFLNTFKYAQEKVVLDKYTIMEKHSSRTVYNWLQYFEPEQLRLEIERIGFRLESIHANVAGDVYQQTSDEFAVVARKR